MPLAGGKAWLLLGGLAAGLGRVGAEAWLRAARRHAGGPEELSKNLENNTEVATKTFQYLMEVGPGFWNIRQPFSVDNIPVSTHMSVARLNDGKFVVIDTVDITTDIQRELNELTKDGSLIAAVVATHPWHTVFFPAFHALYPATADRRYFGTERHLRKQKDVVWSGDISKVFLEWPELPMVATGGTDLADQGTEDGRKKLASVFVFHNASKTVHNDDTIMILDLKLMASEMGADATEASVAAFWKNISSKITGPGMHFHPSLFGPGLNQNPAAAWEFKRSIQRVLSWDFINFCAAHNSEIRNTAKEALQNLLDRSEMDFVELSSRFAASGSSLARMPTAT